MFGVCFPQNERLEHEDHIRTKQQNHLITSRQFSRFSHSSCLRFTGPYNSINGPSFYRPTFGLKILTMTKTRMKYSALSPGELQIWDMTWDKRGRKASRTPVMVGSPRPLNENCGWISISSHLHTVLQPASSFSWATVLLPTKLVIGLIHRISVSIIRKSHPPCSVNAMAT